MNPRTVVNRRRFYPAPGDAVKVSDNTAKMKGSEDLLVKVFHGLKTFEYDLALHAGQPQSDDEDAEGFASQDQRGVQAAVDAAVGDAAKARALFSGMFERKQNNVQKGRFGQALAQTFSEPGVACDVPEYIRDAVTHACQGAASKP